MEPARISASTRARSGFGILDFSLTGCTLLSRRAELNFVGGGFSKSLHKAADASPYIVPVTD